MIACMGHLTSFYEDHEIDDFENAKYVKTRRADPRILRPLALSLSISQLTPVASKSGGIAGKSSNLST